MTKILQQDKVTKSNHVVKKSKQSTITKSKQSVVTKSKQSTITKSKQSVITKSKQNIVTTLQYTDETIQIIKNYKLEGDTYCFNLLCEIENRYVSCIRACRSTLI